MIQLKGKQSSLKGRLTNIQNQIDDSAVTPLSIERHTHLKRQLTEYAKRAELLNEQIYEIADPSEYAAQDIEADTIDLKIGELNDRLALIHVPVLTSSPHVGSDFGIRLPKFDIPTFSGNMQDWTSFYDLFVATIHNNSKLSKAHKLQYLKSALKGTAATVIQALQITDANYEEAWNLLADRYNNQREIVHSHVKRLYSQPVMKEESAFSLRKLIDTTQECIRALKVLNRPVDNWDDMVVVLVADRLDSETRRQWILHLPDDSPPSYKDLIKFLDLRARAMAEAGETSKLKQPVKTGGDRKPTMAVHFGASRDGANREGSNGKCVSCSGTHQLYACPNFSKLSVTERKTLVKQLNLCFNCLRSSHIAAKCTSGSCRKCKEKHNTLLHDSIPQPEPQTGDTIKSHVSMETDDRNPVLLSTAIVKVTDRTGNLQQCRALLDNASEASFITDECVKRLGLQRQRIRSSVMGVGGSKVGVAKSTVQLHIMSTTSQFSCTVTALVLQTVTRSLPSARCDPTRWAHLKSIQSQLADPGFNDPGTIDVLLGADIFGELITAGRRYGKKGEPVAISTTLGWVVSGPTGSSPSTLIVSNHVHCELETVLRKFWELEEVPNVNPSSPEEKLCEQHFNETHSRDEDGRFVVRLPFRDNHKMLGESFNTAFRRLKQIERRFEVCSDLKQQYTDFMREYEALGHMQRIPRDQLDRSVGSHYYLPHHAVLKNSMAINKFRVVFDASAKTTSGTSLNDILLVGPKVQDDLVPILLRFRFHSVALCADVGKMYRQIRVHRDDWDFQRILWREDSTLPVQHYWLTTVTYGTASAPYQATKCTQQLALNEQSSFPQASSIWIRDAYVDDLMTGEQTTQAAIKLQRNLTELMHRGCFNLCKWATNDEGVQNIIPLEKRASQQPLNLDSDSTVKTLGLHYQPARDEFFFKVYLPPVQNNITKRIILSDMSRIFDPLGWISPVTIRAKILFQQLWRIEVGWDDSLQVDICKRWITYREDLHNIETIRLPRCVIPMGKAQFQLHGFSDASENAYSGVIYLRYEDENGYIGVNLLMAKTKVAPLKKISIPRLELCSSLLLARLMKFVLKALAVEISEIWAWSDSTVVLSYLACPSDRWKTFVANRVTEIQETIHPDQWHHVAGKENPADCFAWSLSF